MDKFDSFRAKAILAAVFSTASLCLLLAAVSRFIVRKAPPLAVAKPSWAEALRDQLAKLESRYPGKFGVYVKVFGDGESLSVRAGEPWYIASGVKVPIALEVFRRIDSGEMRLDDMIELGDDDFVDGAGETNSRVPGSLVAVEYLLEQMLIHSDNTASDLLIRRVGLENLNASVRAWTGGAFAPITRLADVRRFAFGELSPNAFALANRDFRALKAIADESAKIAEFVRLARVDGARLKRRTLDDAYNAYYSTRLNSASLEAYGALLEDAFSGRILSPESTARLVSILERVETGRERIRAGLGGDVVYAHKTGTQRARICDFGVAWREASPERKVIINACTRDIPSLSVAEAILMGVGRAVESSGVLDPVRTHAHSRF